MMNDRLITCRRILATLLVALPMLATAAHAQQVVVIVNGDPITALDIEQRTKSAKPRSASDISTTASSWP